MIPQKPVRLCILGVKNNYTMLLDIILFLSGSKEISVGALRHVYNYMNSALYDILMKAITKVALSRCTREGQVVLALKFQQEMLLQCTDQPLAKLRLAGGGGVGGRFESMSFVVNIFACKLKIVNNRN